MAESNHDDLADALARMAGGKGETLEHQEDVPTPPPKPVRPAPVKPAVTRPAAPGTSVPPKPRAVTPAASAPAPIKPARPAAPALASQPQPAAPVRPTAPVIRKDRPTAPTIRQSPAEPDVDGGQSTGLSSQADDSQIIDDDDSVIVPAPEASVFMPKAKPITSADARAKIQKKKRLEYRRTLIPILLTTGVMLLIFGVLKFLAGPDSQLANIPGWAPLMLLGIGVFLLVLAGINMLSVKHELAADEK
jgi:hypothetical protein